MTGGLEDELEQATHERVAAEKAYREASAKVSDIRPLGLGEDPKPKPPEDMKASAAAKRALDAAQAKELELRRRKR